MFGWLKKLGGAGVDVEGVGRAFSEISDGIAQLRFGGKDEAEFAHHRAEILAKVDRAQLALEASGRAPSWRHAVGWVCAISFGIMFCLTPFSLLMLALVGEVTPHEFEIADYQALVNVIFDEQIVSGFMPVLLGMLGLGAMRSYDKRNSPTGKGRRKSLRAAVKARTRLAAAGMEDEEIDEMMEMLEGGR